MGKSCTPTVIGCPGSGTCRYRSTRFAVMVVMATLVGGGWRSTASLYNPLIRIHASQMRGRSDMRRYLTADPTSAALQCRSSWILALIVRLSTLEFCWSPFWLAKILVSLRRQVSGDIHAWWICSLWVGLECAPRAPQRGG